MRQEEKEWDKIGWEFEGYRSDEEWEGGKRVAEM